MYRGTNTYLNPILNRFCSIQINWRSWILLDISWKLELAKINPVIHCDGCENIMSVDLPESESISEAEINLSFFAVSNGVLCCNLAESKSVLKMCISKHCHEVTGFLSWIGTYCISCVVQQRSRVKDLSFLVGYNNSWLGEIRLGKSIKGIQSLVVEIFKITQSKLNCQRLQYENIHFILCSCINYTHYLSNQLPI